jgi:membrane-associated phospholipid phosphatase
LAGGTLDSLFSFGLQIIVWIQSTGAWLSPVMKFFTFLGSTEFYLLIAPAILWCVDSVLGVRLGIFLMINATVNAALKVAFHGPRPYWYSSDLKVFSGAEESFGAPSGHSQNAVVVWGTLADRIKSRLTWIIAIIIMFMIGISRIFLALHFPHDVLLGWLFGAIMLWILLRLEKPVVNWIKQFSVSIQLIVIFLFSLSLILLVVIAQLTLRGWSVPVEWVNNAHIAFPTEPPINPLSYHNFLSSTGAFFGLASGWIWISSLGGFSIRDPWFKLIGRYIVGVVGVLILYLGLKHLLPQEENFFSYALAYIQFALIGFWMSGLAPWLFVKLKLASPIR